MADRIATGQSKNDKEGLSPVITKDESQRFHDLGLGRGVNVTDHQMWKNKSHFLIRTIKDDLSNVIGTEESGMMEKYEKEVTTVAKQQVKIRLSLEDPSSQVKIGMDAHHSQSTSSTKIIAGTKVKTRTISFRVDCNDLPVCTAAADPNNSIDVLTGLKSEESIETSLYSWIFDRMKKRGRIKSNVKSLATYLAFPPNVHTKSIAQELTEIANDCKLFVNELGITHYVSGIELGALKYSVFTSSSHQTTQGGGAEVGAGKLAEGGISGIARKLHMQTSREQQEIGKIRKDTPITRSTTDEAVIGFQIQPIHNLVRLQLIQVALQKAVKKYIEFKADKSVGPFQISCKINKETIYWRADEETHQVVGTDSEANASLFFITPTEDANHPSEFFITHYEKEFNEDEHFNEDDPFIKMQIKKSQCPWHVASNGNMLGFCSQPLDLKSTVRTQHARFSLHSRVQQSFAFMTCLSTAVSLGDWIDGEEFYINCSRRSFQIDGYIAMKRQQYPFGPYGAYTYKTQTVATMKDPSLGKGIGMLFRLSKKRRKPQSRFPLSLVEKPLQNHSNLSTEPFSENEPDWGDESSSEDETESKKLMEFKAGKSFGPFQISCKINKQTVYWRADEENKQVMGTDSKAIASPFFISPTEDSYRPSEFFLTHYEKEDEKLNHVASSSNTFGLSSQPLDLALTEQARFSLHSRVQPSFPFLMCSSTPAIPSDWIEGKNLYIKCSQNSFEVDRYIAMKRLRDPSGVYVYSTQTVTTMKHSAQSKDIGMLFRLKKFREWQSRASQSLFHSSSKKHELLLSTELDSEFEVESLSLESDCTVSSRDFDSEFEVESLSLESDCTVSSRDFDSKFEVESLSLESDCTVSSRDFDSKFEVESLKSDCTVSSLTDSDSSYTTAFESEGELQQAHTLELVQHQPITALGNPVAARKKRCRVLRKRLQPEVPTESRCEEESCEEGPTVISLQESNRSLSNLTALNSEREFQPQTQPIAAHLEPQQVAILEHEQIQTMTAHRKSRSTQTQPSNATHEDTLTSGVRRKRRPASSKPLQLFGGPFPVSVASTYALRYEQIFGSD